MFESVMPYIDTWLEGLIQNQSTILEVEPDWRE